MAMDPGERETFAALLGEGPRPVMWRQKAYLMLTLQECPRQLQWLVT